MTGVQTCALPSLDPRADVIGGTGPVRATLTARRLVRRVDGAVITWPTVLQWDFPRALPVELVPPPIGEAVELELTTPAGPGIRRVVTFTGPTVTWAALTDVDPASLEPDAPEPPAAAWAAALQQIRDRITPTVALSQAEYDALTPDPSTLYLITS